MPEERRANRLINEKSPYLLEHAYNPVDWYPWGDEAFEKGQGGGQADLPQHRLLHLSLVPSCSHESPSRTSRSQLCLNSTVRLDKGRQRREAGPRRDLHEVRDRDKRAGRLAALGLPDPRPEALLRRDVLPARPAHGLPGFPQVLDFVSDLWKNKRAKSPRTPRNS